MLILPVIRQETLDCGMPSTCAACRWVSPRTLRTSETRDITSARAAARSGCATPISAASPLLRWVLSWMAMLFDPKPYYTIFGIFRTVLVRYYSYGTISKRAEFRVGTISKRAGFGPRQRAERGSGRRVTRAGALAARSGGW